MQMCVLRQDKVNPSLLVVQRRVLILRATRPDIHPAGLRARLLGVKPDLALNLRRVCRAMRGDATSSALTARRQWGRSDGGGIGAGGTQVAAVACGHAAG